MNLFDVFIFSLNAIMPLILIILLGYFLKQSGRDGQRRPACCPACSMDIPCFRIYTFWIHFRFNIHQGTLG